MTPERRILVRRLLKADYENGRSYYPFNGKPLAVLPENGGDLPSSEYLAWHIEHVFLG